MASREDNKGRYVVGKVADFAKRKGWFFGHFADDDLLRSDLVEVAWQDISGKEASADDRHYHTDSVEINIVLSGKMRFTLNNEFVEVSAGGFYVVWPETVIANLEADDNTELIVISAPSVNDKVVE